jgi:hypothetical protein
VYFRNVYIAVYIDARRGEHCPPHLQTVVYSGGITQRSVPHRSFPGLCIVVLVLAIAAAGCAVTAPESQDTLNRTLDALTLEEKIGQMLLVGFRGYSVDNDSGSPAISPPGVSAGDPLR